MPIGDVYQLRVATDYPPQCAINVFHYVCTSQGGPGATLTEMAANFGGVLAAAWKAITSSLATFRGCGVKIVWPSPTIEGVSTAAAGPGTAFGNTLPWQTCGLIHLQTAFPGRSGRGRVYLPFPADSGNTATGVPNVLYTGGASVLAIALKGPINCVGASGSTTVQLIVYNKRTTSYFSVQTMAVRPGWATQRRRSFFGRPNPPPF